MHPKSAGIGVRAFTLIELLLLIAIICILAALVAPPTSREKNKALQMACLNHQKQIAIGLTLFSEDHHDAYPAHLSVTNGGAREPMSAGDVVPCYKLLNESNTIQSVFLCPSDRLRPPAQQGQSLTRTNVSYFISLDASPTNSPTYTILTGDRHLAADTKTVRPGLFLLSTNQELAWTTELHSPNKQPSGGAFGFADGHAEWISPKALAGTVARQNMAANRLAVP